MRLKYKMLSGLGSGELEVKDMEAARRSIINLNKNIPRSGELTDHVTTWQWDNKKKVFV